MHHASQVRLFATIHLPQSSRKTMPRLIHCLGLALVSFAAYSQEKPVYEHVQIGDNQIAYSCKGQGDFTIVFISGMGMSVQQSFTNTYFPNQDSRRICLYDRAELGQSHMAGDQPRSL